MKRTNGFKKYIVDDAGFSFIEIAIALIIIGMLSGAGLLLFGKIADSAQRKETVQRMNETKNALLLYAKNQGKLPVVTGYYQKIGSSPIDSWQNAVSYKVSQNISQEIGTLTQFDVCKRLKNPDGYSGWTPASWIALDEQIKGVNYLANGTGEKAVVALLLSGGARDADVAGNLFDGGNATGTPNYVRKYPAEDFDDIVVAITADEMYGAIRDSFCTATVAVTDNRAVGALYYIFNRTTLKDIGSANWQDPAVVVDPLLRTTTVKVLLGEQIEIRDSAGGTGGLMTANKLLPLPVVAPLPFPATITAATTISLP